MESDSRTPTIRPRASILLLDASGRLLLVGAEDPGGAWDQAVWVPLGGAVELGETYEEAAVRELFEETGIPIASVGPYVWEWHALFPWGTELYDTRERFFVVQIPSGEGLVLRGNTGAEKDDFRRFQSRWWTASEVRESDKLFAPPQMARLLPDVVAGRYPSEPIRLSGWD